MRTDWVKPKTKPLLGLTQKQVENGLKKVTNINESVNVDINFFI